VISTRWATLALLPALLVGCSNDTTPAPDPGVAASAPLPGVTLPPDALRDLVPAPDEVPAGMTPLLAGSGPRDLAVVAGYSGTGADAKAAEKKLSDHGFVKAYVAQYANQATAQSITVLVSEFAAANGAAADLTDDIEAFNGKVVPTETLGEQSQVSIQETPGAGASQLVLVRFRKGVHTWLVSYSATPTADPKVATDLAALLLARA
jgi:hypothetical protein